jgi:hypothetical protein
MLDHVQAFFVVTIESMTEADRRLAEDQAARFVSSLTCALRSIARPLTTPWRHARRGSAPVTIPAQRGVSDPLSEHRTAPRWGRFSARQRK